MPAVVVADSLTKRYGKLTAVDDLSFELDAGTVTGFLGPNGAGKTTTLRMLLGLAKPTSGSALVFGEPYARLRRPALRVGAVLEATDFHPGRSGRNHLRTLALRDRGRRRAGRRGAAARRARRGEEPAREGLLARDAAAARPGRRAARRPGAARPRRAGERARPRGRALAARLPALVRGRRAHGARLEPRARRGRADRRPRPDHQPRPARGRVDARAADGARRRRGPRPLAAGRRAARGARARGDRGDRDGRRAVRARARRASGSARSRPRTASSCTSS